MYFIAHAAFVRIKLMMMMRTSGTCRTILTQAPRSSKNTTVEQHSINIWRSQSKQNLCHTRTVSSLKTKLN